MKLPKVKFKNISVSKEIEWFYNFIFYNKTGWQKYIFRRHPRLKSVYNLKTKRAREKYIEAYIREYLKNNKDEIRNNRSRIEKLWGKKEKEFLINLEEILEIKWLVKKDITSLISINPICPRFLHDWSFFIYYRYKNYDILEVIMHELCHFLYFKKFKELFPKIPARKYDYPYIEWHLSELIAPIILNDSRINKFLKKKAVFYPEYKKIKIGKISAPVYFTRLYNTNLKKKNNFDNFLIDAYKLIKKHKKLFT